ncbi:hypothetical protein SGFS_003400 [Streptomyces graminofaciens]|uniref:HTH gntR-type domain-containing protein n=1 Tax=Streptomyces graminofaciens TaxID=68212 RepID=A0ABM7F043_9ACTN|nr:hypothetical protein SGFS_003400 [Streptomyces graminofaciens]
MASGLAAMTMETGYLGGLAAGVIADVTPPGSRRPHLCTWISAALIIRTVAVYKKVPSAPLTMAPGTRHSVFRHTKFIPGKQRCDVAGSGLDLRVTQDKLVRDKVVDALRRAILDGALQPGRRLTERELTELTGVSRTSVREALRRLQAEGLVEESPSRGLRVTTPTAEEIEQIYEIRAELEPLAVRLFVERATQEEVDELASVTQELNPGGDANKDVLDRFDGILLAGCRNPMLAELLGGLYGRIHALRRISAATPGRMAVTKQEYADLIDAVRRRSAADAAEVARRHVSAARASAKVAMGLLKLEAD